MTPANLPSQPGPRMLAVADIARRAKDAPVLVYRGHPSGGAAYVIYQGGRYLIDSASLLPPDWLPQLRLALDNLTEE